MLIGIFGDLGSYKTSFLTLLCLYASTNGLEVISNYNLTFADRLTLSDLLGLTVQTGNIDAKGFMALDEVYYLLESRISQSRVNRGASYFVLQSRKLGWDLGYTAQLSSSVDLRLYELTDVKIYCYGLDQNTGFVRFGRVFGEQNEVRFSIPYSFFVENIFPVYDTKEIVNPLGIEELQIEIEMKDDLKKFNSRVDVATKRVFDYINGRYLKVSRHLVDDSLLRLEMPEVLGKYVYNRLLAEYIK